MDRVNEITKKTGLGANKRTAVIIVALIVIPVATGLLAREQQIRNGNSSGDVLAETQTLDVIEKVGALMELPDEEPTIATVSDASKLSDQQFFSKAQNGDVVVIFPNAQKAILYRPSTDKIIEIALYTPPSVTPAGEVAQPSPTPIQSLQDLIGGASPTSSPEPTSSTSPSPEPVVNP